MKSTPVSKKLLRRKTHQIKIKLDGFQDYETTLTRKVNGWVFGNIVLGGAVGHLSIWLPGQFTAFRRAKQRPA